MFGQCIHFSASSGVRSADRFAVWFAPACLVVRSACVRPLLQIDQPKGAAFGCSFWWNIQGCGVEYSLRLLFLLLFLSRALFGACFFMFIGSVLCPVSAVRCPVSAGEDVRGNVWRVSGCECSVLPPLFSSFLCACSLRTSIKPLKLRLIEVIEVD